MRQKEAEPDALAEAAAVGLVFVAKKMTKKLTRFKINRTTASCTIVLFFTISRSKKAN